CGDTRVVGEVHRDAVAVGLGRRTRGGEREGVAVDVDRDPAPRLVVAADVLLHPTAGPPSVVADVRRGRVRHAVPPRDPDLVGEVVGGGGVHARLVEHLDARAGAGVDAGDVVQGVDL